MPANFSTDCSLLDRPEVLACLFYPRPGFSRGSLANAPDLSIAVAEDVVVGGRGYLADPAGTNILFFHGNGEIVQDYDDIGAFYVARGINFIAVDYRGYGRSTGRPTASTLLADSHVILGFIANWLKQQDHTGPLLVMGRSLGSASALELACHDAGLIDGLILESAFAHTGPLLGRIGVELALIRGFDEQRGFRQLDKIRAFAKPTLLIHAEQDHLIPFADGQALYDASPAPDKHLLKIPRADHNTLFAVGWRAYLDSVEAFAHPLRFRLTP
ncbi:MAG: alpha/beta fold hydrolase [Candidatus Competibacteraceae bacterium]|nr:alpha/beta fold hydrolase [Candidatus Competibacteraceae bacterium]